MSTMVSQITGVWRLFAHSFVHMDSTSYDIYAQTYAGEVLLISTLISIVMVLVKKTVAVVVNCCFCSVEGCVVIVSGGGVDGCGVFVVVVGGGVGGVGGGIGRDGSGKGGGG